MWCKGLRACNAVRVRCLEVSCFALVFQSPHALWVLSVTFRLELFFCDGRSVKSKESIKWCDDKIWKLVVATQYTCNRVLPCACRHNGQAKPSVDSYRDSMRFEGFSNLVTNRVTVWAHTHTHKRNSQCSYTRQQHPPTVHIAAPSWNLHTLSESKWIEMPHEKSFLDTPSPNDHSSVCWGFWLVWPDVCDAWCYFNACYRVSMLAYF